MKSKMKLKPKSDIALFCRYPDKSNRNRIPRQLWFTVTILFCFLLWGCNTPVTSPVEMQATQHDDSREVKMALLLDIAATLLSDKKISNDIKSEISRQLVLPLGKSNTVAIAGKDMNTRPLAVNFQKVFEQSLVDLLNEGKISRITAVIHTPMPATPLCNPPGKSLSATMHPDIQKDPVRIKTIEDRTFTTRRMASYGGDMTLYIAYPETGLAKRSSAEQQIYRNELKNKNNVSLIDTPLACASLPDHLIGASYLIVTPDKQKLFFSLTGKQAVAGTGMTDWQIWFGELSDTQLSKRHDEIVGFLKQYSQKFKL